MKIQIKNMHSSRCIAIVQQEMESMHLASRCDELGIINVVGTLSKNQWYTLHERLDQVGLELMMDKKTKIAIQIKSIINDLLSSNEDDYSEVHISTYLQDKLKMDYPTLAKAFSARNSVTLKQFIIRERVKKVKELILKHHDNLSAISSKLNYSSTAHLCHEFKKITGFTPKFFKKFL
jgi:AraC-like DNA-binding protein